MYETIILLIGSSILLFVFTGLLQKVYRPRLRTSAISVKSKDNKCIVRVEKSRR